MRDSAANTSDNPLSLDVRQRRRQELRAVIAQTLPTVIITSSRGFMDVADVYMLSRLDDKSVIAAILSAQMMLWSYIVIGFGMAMMVNTFVAQALGRKDYRECSAYAWQSVYLAACFGIIGFALISVLPIIVRWVGHDSLMQQMELSYLHIAVWTIFPTIAAEGLVGFFTGIHKPSIAMWTALESNVINVIACLVLIYGWFGFPRLGIAGAATGTLVAVTYRMVRLAVTMLSHRMNETFNARETWRFSRPRFARLIRVGIPFGVQSCAEVTVWATFVNILIGRFFGTSALTANNIAWQFLRIAFMPCAGVGRAVSALVGKSIGAGQPERAMREARLATILTLTYMSTLALIWVVFRSPLIATMSHDPEVIRIGSVIMIFAAVFQVFDAVTFTYSGALRGAGDTLVPSAFFILSNWIIIVGGGWFMARTFPDLGSIGPWIMASSLIIVTSLFLWWRWHSRAWMKIDLFQDKESSTLGPENVAQAVGAMD